MKSRPFFYRYQNVLVCITDRTNYCIEKFPTAFMKRERALLNDCIDLCMFNYVSSILN